MFPADRTDSPRGFEKLPEPLMLAIFQLQSLQVLAFPEVPGHQSQQRSKIWALTWSSRHPGAFTAPEEIHLPRSPQKRTAEGLRREWTFGPDLGSRT